MNALLQAAADFTVLASADRVRFPDVYSWLMDEIESHLVHSGKYVELSNLLREKLEESGWYDDVLAYASSKLGTAEDPRLGSPEVQAVHNQAMRMVPESVKVEMLQVIFTLLDDLVEKA